MLSIKNSISNKSIRKKNKKQEKSSKRYNPYTVAGGDSKGKVTYTYPTGNSEDY